MTAPEYEVHVRGGYMGVAHPMLAARAPLLHGACWSGSLTTSRQKPIQTHDFSQFHPYGLKIADVIDGKVDLTSEWSDVPAHSGVRRLSRIDAFLEVEGINLGSWWIAQGIELINPPARKQKSQFYFARFHPSVAGSVQLFSALSRPPESEEVDVSNIIPIGSLQCFNASHGEEKRQKLLERLPLLNRQLDVSRREKADAPEANSILHAGDYYESLGSYRYLPILVGRFEQ